MFHADLHIHSRFSRACSKDAEIPQLAWWAARKGVTVVGTGDFTHPAWAVHLAESLIPAEPGLFRLRPELAARLGRTLPPSCPAAIRFLLSTNHDLSKTLSGHVRAGHDRIRAEGGMFGRAPFGYQIQGGSTARRSCPPRSASGTSRRSSTGLLAGNRSPASQHG